MRFPKVIRFRRVEATIYGQTLNYPFYRVAYCVAGKCQVRHFKTYQEAKDEAERVSREMGGGSQNNQAEPSALLKGLVCGWLAICRWCAAK